MKKHLRQLAERCGYADLTVDQVMRVHAIRMSKSDYTPNQLDNKLAHELGLDELDEVELKALTYLH